MDDETRLIETLRRGQGTPPLPPADEWFRVAKRTVGAQPPRRHALAWGLGVGAAAAGFWLLVPGALPLAPRVAAALPLAPAEELRQDLEPLSASADVSDDDNSGDPGNEMLLLLDSV